MSNYTFIDCNGLAGFLSFGLVDSGMKMESRVGTLDFGNPVALANRKYLGQDWDYFFSNNYEEWPTKEVDVVVGCPPCSGWSVWSGEANRGLDAKAHEHTRAFIKYAARVKPKMVVYESVQQAFTQGREAMLAYRDTLEELSGKKYDLYHVKHNNLQIGGFSFRARYFWIAVEEGMKFGAVAHTPAELPTIMDIIGDLAEQPRSWEAQDYIAEPSKWVKHLRSKDGKVTAHIGRQNANSQRIEEVFSIIGNHGWDPNLDFGNALRRAVEKNNGEFPPQNKASEERALRRDFNFGFSQPYRWRYDSWVNVMTGSALDHVVHPSEPRLITHREAARMQGLPDDWEIESVKDYSALPAVWGKAVSFQAAKWLGGLVVSALDGNPQGDQGELIGDREYLLNLDAKFSRHAVRKQWYSDSIADPRK
jgi:site-specific DNA-cytosine methylase